MFLQLQAGQVHMWVNCTALVTSQAKPLRYLLTDPRQFDILPKRFCALGHQCNSLD
jgi:hypothetical protein